MNLFHRIRAVLFDADNTLLATDTFVKETILQTMSTFVAEGIHIDIPVQETLEKVFQRNLSFEDVFQTLFPTQWEQVILRYRELAKTKLYSATPGAIALVQKLKMQGVTMGIVTNRKRMLEERLEQAGFHLEDFAFTYQPNANDERKPHPKSLDAAIGHLRETHGIHRNEILVIGDHTDDMQAARAHGLLFMAVLSGESTKEEFLSHGLDTLLILPELSAFIEVLKHQAVAQTYRESLTRISAIDGRHAQMTQKLALHFSEYALHKHRVLVEITHIMCLDKVFPGQILPRRLTHKEVERLFELGDTFSEEDAMAVMEYDHLGRNNIGPTEHDVKSCELRLREKMKGTSLEDILPYIHIFLTSEDVNNLAYKMMLTGAVNEVFAPSVTKLTDRLAHLAHEHLYSPVMSRTHLQPASPTTFGKIFTNYLVRLNGGLERLAQIHLTGKVNGAVGNYNAFAAACPDLDWIQYSKELTGALGFDVELYTDQRGTHVDMIRVLQAIQEVNNVLRDLATDLSLYAAFGTMSFSKVESHVGSSTMPHKVNPWFAEVAEGNCKKANALINVFANEMDVSRMQRDLSDHDFERSYGEAIGYVLVAIKHMQIALDMIHPEIEGAMKELESHPEIVTEAIQTVLRFLGKADAYDQLKNAFRGAHPSFGEIRNFVLELDIPEDKKSHLLEIIQPGRYIGAAVRLTQEAILKYETQKARRKHHPVSYLFRNA